MRILEPVVIGVTQLHHRHHVEGAEGTGNCAACEITRLQRRVEGLEKQSINALKTALGDSIVLLDVILRRSSFGFEDGAISRQIKENQAALRGER